MTTTTFGSTIGAVATMSRDDAARLAVHLVEALAATGGTVDIWLRMSDVRDFGTPDKNGVIDICVNNRMGVRAYVRDCEVAA